MLIRIVDDDTDLAESLKFLLETEGWTAVCYSSAEDFLTGDAPSVPGCILLDIRMCGMSGLELQEEMKNRDIKLPIIFLTGHGDLDIAVEAMKFGAKDFLQKPVKAEKLIQSISAVLNQVSEERNFGESLDYWKEKFSLLSDREKEVIKLAAQGLLSQEIGERLSISTRTVHTHRLNAYKKLGVHNVAELAPIAVLSKKTE